MELFIFNILLLLNIILLIIIIHQFYMYKNSLKSINEESIPVFDKEDITKKYENKKDKLNKHLEDIYQIVLDSKTPLEGNSFYIHTTLDLYPILLTKQINLFWCGTQAVSHICEIGFNAGHSTLLMLLGRDNTALNFTIFDIGHHAYTKPSFEYIKKEFPHIAFEYIEGDSIVTMPNWIDERTSLIETYDVIHVDGGHSEGCILNDMKNADKLLKINGILIIDDTNDTIINNYVNKYINGGKYKDLDVLTTLGYPHRIIQKINK